MPEPVHDDIRSLIESLRRGQYEDPTEKISLLAAALQEHGAPADLLLSLLRAPQVPLRLAALDAVRTSSDPGIHQALGALATDSDLRVRLRLAEVLAAVIADTAEDALQILLQDSDRLVRRAAVDATRGKPRFRERHGSLLQEDPDWEVRHAAALSLAENLDDAFVPHLVVALGRDQDGDVRQRCAEGLDRYLARFPPGQPPDLQLDPSRLLAAAQALAGTPGTHTRLGAWLRGATQSMVDLQALARFGTDLTSLAEAGTLPRAYRVEKPLAMLLAMLRREPRRSLALIGRSGCGKSALVQELVYALAKPENGAWRVLRMSPTDFMAGTRYVGEWETKLAELVAAIRRPRRVLLYVPSLDELAAVGRWSKSDANVASALGPYVEDGSIVILGESTPEEFERGLGGETALARLFEKVLVEDSDIDDTTAVLRGIRDESRARIDDAVLGELRELSESFLGHIARPGAAANLLRAVLAELPDRDQPVVRRDVLDVLSKSTGVPASLLDDAVPLSSTALRGFFEDRIVGQPEAVQAVVDLVTLIKAGLTDPAKPFGVLLFVGPTGVGKTELARALADYVFGDASRLLRFDMSEYAAPESFTRLIGARGENGLLTDPIRQRPFSVILLDEIEKSHINVFDLCLQIFDAGRLTDGRGRLVDFRRSVVILTSNVGAETPVAPLGFQPADSPPESTVDRDRTFRELSRVFRPEFLNRLDRIVNFRPLSPAVAERIARRELDLVLRRSGVARRSLTVHVDPAVTALLVREGYSPHFGARPLKRTVERLVMLPLARAIAGGRVTSGQVVTLTARENVVEVDVATPAPAAATAATAASPSPALSPSPPGSAALASPASGRRARPRFQERLNTLAAALEPLRPPLDALTQRKSDLLGRTQDPAFHKDNPEREIIFDELHRLDQFLSRVDRWRLAIHNLQTRPQREPAEPHAATALAERLEELAAELRQIEFVATCSDVRELGDALVLVRLTSSRGPVLDTVPTLARMYLGLATRRHLLASVVAERAEPAADLACLQVVGLGAVALFSREIGLHEFHQRQRTRKPRAGGDETTEASALASVEVYPIAGRPDRRFISSLTSRVTPLKPARSRLLEKAAWEVSVFDGHSLRSLDAWYSGTRAQALESAACLLWTQVKGADGQPKAPPAVIRRYELGIGSHVRDLRTGRSTTRLSQVFRGRLESLLAPED